MTPINFLGKAPNHILPNDLLDYFLYTFEFAWTAPGFDAYRSNIKTHFEVNLKDLMGKHAELTLGQQWWGLILIALKDFAIEREFSYASKTIDLLLSNLSQLKEPELEQYANEINSGIYDEILDSISIRPLELEILKSDAMNSDKMLKFFLENKDRFLKIFNKHLIQRDIDKDYLRQFLFNEKKVDNKFSSFWRVFFEIYVGYSMSVLQYSLNSSQAKKMTVKELINKTNLVFLLASVLSKGKIEDLTQDLENIMKEFFDIK